MDLTINFDRQKFFIGLMDFFSILLPGALLTYPQLGAAGPAVPDHYDKSVGSLRQRLAVTPS